MMKAAEELPTGELRVRLHPFLHQVSGSTVMFNFDTDTLCKPLLPKEYHFYKCLPDSLKEFTAKFKGSIKIEVEEDADGSVFFYGVVPHSKVSALNLDTNVSSTEDQQSINPAFSVSQPNFVDYFQKENLRLKRNGSIEMDEDSLDSYDNPLNKLEIGKRLNKRLANLLDNAADSQHRFILLENLVSNFRRPCILDLKMGTRTHDDDDADSKKFSKRTKCENSTSKPLGVRLHGMQKYNVCNEKFVTLNKHEGRKLTVEEFKDTIVGFLCNNEQLRHELIQPIYEKLKKFYQCVSQQNTFRFYASSLLIIFDGAASSSQPGNVDVRAIDFAHATHESSPHSQDNLHVGPDKGYLLGIQTLIDILSDLRPTEMPA